MDPNFEKTLRSLKDQARQRYEARKTCGQAKWFRPPDWDGDPFNLEGLGEPFDRSAANEDLVSAISDPADPGTTGDVVACSVMINFLSVAERAFRVRQTLRRPRAAAHCMARERGHGDDSGPFVQLGVEYVRGLLKQAKKDA